MIRSCQLHMWLHPLILVHIKSIHSSTHCKSTPFSIPNVRHVHSLISLDLMGEHLLMEESWITCAMPPRPTLVLSGTEHTSGTKMTHNSPCKVSPAKWVIKTFKIRKVNLIITISVIYSIDSDFYMWAWPTLAWLNVNAKIVRHT